jgi:hypothetical protein
VGGDGFRRYRDLRAFDLDVQGAPQLLRRRGSEDAFASLYRLLAYCTPFLQG